MSIKIRNMIKEDRNCVIEMMKEFYASPAVSTNGSEEIFNHDINNCVSECPYLEGYIFQNNEVIHGYAMIAKSFSTEFGRICICIEDLYIKKEYRGKGIATKFFKYIEQKYPNTVIMLEVEKENDKAIKLYKKCGYKIFPYLQMKKLC